MMSASTSSSWQPRRWNDQAVSDSEEEGDDIEVFWETTSILSDIPLAPPAKDDGGEHMGTTTTTSTPRRTTGNKRFAVETSPLPDSKNNEIKGISTTTTTGSSNRRRRTRKKHGSEPVLGQAVDASTLHMVSQLAMRFNTRSAAARASSGVTLSGKTRSEPGLLRDKMSVVNSPANGGRGTGGGLGGKGKGMIKAATVPTARLPSAESRGTARSTSVLGSSRIISRDPRTSSSSSSNLSLETPIRPPPAPLAAVPPAEVGERTSAADEFDDLFAADDSFEHILSQYDEDSLISNATTLLVSSGSITINKQTYEKGKAPKIGSPVPRGPDSSGEAVGGGRTKVGSSPRRSARNAGATTTATDLVVAGPSRSTTTMNKFRPSVTSVQPQPGSGTAMTRPAALIRSASSCSQAEAQERLKHELQTLAEQDGSFWSEEGEEV